MFADLLSDSDWSNHSHRRWTTLISFALQAIAVGCLLLLPLFYTEGLPRLAMLAPILAPAPLHSAPPAQSRSNPPSTAQSHLTGTQLVSPPQIPQDVVMLTETVPPPPVDPTTLGVSRGNPRGSGTVFNSMLGSDLSVVLHLHPPSITLKFRA